MLIPEMIARFSTLLAIPVVMIFRWCRRAANGQHSLTLNNWRLIALGFASGATVARGWRLDSPTFAAPSKLQNVLPPLASNELFCSAIRSVFSAALDCLAADGDTFESRSLHYPVHPIYCAK